METILFEYIVSLGLSLSIAILVAVRAGRMIHHINAINVETQVTDISKEFLKLLQRFPSGCEHRRK